jgi:hypothetical protein
VHLQDTKSDIKIKFYGMTNVAHISSEIYFSMQNTQDILSGAEVLT